MSIAISVYLEFSTFYQSFPLTEAVCIVPLGNDFGADGIETLKSSLEAKGLLEALGSLSDDEGLEEDDNSEDGEVEPVEETEGDVSTDKKLQVKGEAVPPQKIECQDEAPSEPVSGS